MGLEVQIYVSEEFIELEIVGIGDRDKILGEDKDRGKGENGEVRGVWGLVTGRCPRILGEGVRR